MTPLKSILDKSFAYIPSTATAVEATWRRYGWRPLSDEERKRRSHAVRSADGRVVQLKSAESV
jgi:hypothetical protein